MSVCFGEIGNSEYCRLNISDVDDGKDLLLYEHQLNALIDNSVEEVFNDGKTIHHYNGAKMDNRSDNLTPLNRSEHWLVHDEENWVEEDGERRLKRPYNDVTSY